MLVIHQGPLTTCGKACAFGTFFLKRTSCLLWEKKRRCFFFLLLFVDTIRVVLGRGSGNEVTPDLFTLASMTTILQDLDGADKRKIR